MGLLSWLGYVRKDKHEDALAHMYLQVYWEGYAAAKDEMIRKACGLELVDENERRLK